MAQANLIAPGQQRRMIVDESGRPVVELVRQPFYDRQQITATTAQQRQFFRGNNVGSPLQSNLSTSGMFPNPQSFSLYGVSAFVEFATIEEDWSRLQNEAYINFSLSSKPYLTIPFHMIPAAAGVYGLAATTLNNDLIYNVQNGMPISTNILPLDINGDPIYIISQQDFVVNLVTENTVAFSDTIFIWFYLHGIWYRSVL